MDNYICHKMLDGNINLFPNFNGRTFDTWEWISNLIPQFAGMWLSMLEFNASMLVKGDTEDN